MEPPRDPDGATSASSTIARRPRPTSRSGAGDYPLVVKADGLAAGKGVILADDADDGVEAAEGMLVDGRASATPARRIVVEEMLFGREASFFVLADGERFVELATCQDYKRALDGDGGLNTGGMGTYSPSAFLDAGLAARRSSRPIVRPTIDGLAAEGSPTSGVLYVGVMLTDEGPKVLEYNARFGDPETQVLLPRLDGDWLACCTPAPPAASRSRTLRWKAEAAVCVVMASGGLSRAPTTRACRSRASTRPRRWTAWSSSTPAPPGTPTGALVTAGGRVLGVTALGADLAAARDRAYEAVATDPLGRRTSPDRHRAGRRARRTAGGGETMSRTSNGRAWRS